MSGRAIRFSFFEITWVIIGFLVISIFFLLQQIRVIPPYIILSEKEAVFRFDSGSYTLSEEFRGALTAEIIPQIAELSQSHECDVLQVIGHTDGIGMKHSFSNLDQTIMPFIQSVSDALPPLPGSNVDLGMLRAIAVAQYLESESSKMPFVMHYLSYSAGPTIKPDGSLRSEAGPFTDKNSRRVELRLTISGKPDSE